MPSMTPLRPTLGLARTLNSTARTFSSSASRSIARMIITGRLGGEPELTTTATGQEVVRYSVATHHGSRENRQTSWFRVSSFMAEGGMRDYLLSLPKGTLLYVEGDAAIRSYEGADGKSHQALNIVQRAFEVMRRPNSSYENSENSESQQ